MKNFTKDWIMEPSFDNSLLLFMVVLHLAFILGLGVWILIYLLNLNNIQEMEDEAIVAAVGTAALVLFLTYSFFFGVWKFKFDFPKTYVAKHCQNVSHLLFLLNWV